jgi:16S rRNA (uracil1498-N3)-methyltransferase
MDANGALWWWLAPPVNVDVCIGLVRSNRMDLAIEKCTEAGASLFRPLVCEYSQRHGDASGRTDRWERIAIEAAEQSGRLFVPQVLEPTTFDHLVAMPGQTIVYGDRNGRGLADVDPLLPQTGTITVAIGPEGGFSPKETEALKSAGGIGMSFGNGILRTETAAIAATLFARSMRP